MVRRRGKRGAETVDLATRDFREGLALLRAHPIFAPTLQHAYIVREDNVPYPPDGWACVTSSGRVYLHPKRRGTPEEWLYVLAHCLLHLGFSHFQPRRHPTLWNVACDAVCARFLADMKLGRAPDDLAVPPRDLPGRDEQSIYEHLVEHGVTPEFKGVGTAGAGANSMVDVPERPDDGPPPRWSAYFSEGLRNAVTSAVNVAAGREQSLGVPNKSMTHAKKARDWFISAFPLLGSLAATFELIEDFEMCRRIDVQVAAVDGQARQIYINPAAALTEDECRFVIAHELLHVGLRHETRAQGRDPFLWNAACDYVINDWLIEMEVGDFPQVGGLHDPELKGLSAESVYDRIVTDLRRARKLATFRGPGACDILGAPTDPWWVRGRGVELDGFYRRCLSQGLEYHSAEGRGFLPEGLVEEIRALEQPPVPWDVRLARWFDERFPSVEKKRSYARLSRRQSATPDIPWPSWVVPQEWHANRTFGVVLDTSGSMDRNLLAKALGAIASYSMARDVRHVRVVFCDAAPYDQGYMAPESLMDRVRVKGRGGTVLQPGVNLLLKAEDFPNDGPIMIITDGYCDRPVVQRDHAFLVPAYARLPFAPRGPVFRIS